MQQRGLTPRVSTLKQVRDRLRTGCASFEEHVDGDHDLCDIVYDREYCQDPSTWSGGRSNRTGG